MLTLISVYSKTKNSKSKDISSSEEPITSDHPDSEKSLSMETNSKKRFTFISENDKNKNKSIRKC